MVIIHFQPEFRPALPCVFGAKDYREFRGVLIEMDRILAESGAELGLIRQKVEAYGWPLDPQAHSEPCPSKTGLRPEMPGKHSYQPNPIQIQTEVVR